jgi:hypothetical protein
MFALWAPFISIGFCEWADRDTMKKTPYNRKDEVHMNKGATDVYIYSYHA